MIQTMTDTLEDRITVNRDGEVQIVQTAPDAYDLRLTNGENRPLCISSEVGVLKLIEGLLRYLEYERTTH